ncbi:glycoside hydrolase family 2 TIM barrel-domain containing protein [Pontibacter beigongshangensis]|uniref:glycoside hydrolase family 2 TIM barrel-domain containing protein n=1 Tax=Pontibacter beigongshangensis TaxID=2574733 RepID=UPI00165009F2|nr:glycoside hydrolase family 2 TIM barrel-domain containing protein [Pontibacter beigongshangensis]
MRYPILYLLLCCFFISPTLHAQGRIKSTINSNWLFWKGDTAEATRSVNSWQPVYLPHTWNAQDVLDDEPGYYRGTGWYKKTLYIPADWKDREVYLFFEGAAQVAEVFINGKSVGSHIGSYTFFSFPISSYLTYNTSGNAPNQVLVKVDNSHHPDIPPLTGDYTFFGGIYRDVYLHVMDKVHFAADNHATTGIFITTPNVTASTAGLRIKGTFVNESRQRKNLTIRHQLLDVEGRVFKELNKNYRADAGQRVDFEQELKNIKGARLWSVQDPYLYRVVSTISETGSQVVLDEVSNPLGFRWFSFDAATGFFLNGKPLKLIGASRHQDFKQMGNALPDAMHVRDVELLKAMGGNFLRIAHYPQDPAILQACDRLGILAMIETPMGNHITETEAFAGNSMRVQREMVRQNFNHPSLIVWSYMNEVLLRPQHEKGSERQELYFRKVAQLAQQLEDLTRQEDPYRYTLISNNGNFDLYNKVGLTRIPMLVGWNLYLGWYTDTFSDFGAYLDRHHRELPDKPLLVTEYGADADNRLHSFDPVRFDKTVEYTNAFHQAYLKAIRERPFVAAGLIWNLAEFSSEHRMESTPHINSKGIMTGDRKPKDGYRFYQANLLEEPFVQIGSKEWQLRTGFAASETDLTCTQPVVVFSNQKSVSLKLNGKEIGTTATELGVARFEVPFGPGLNQLQATAGDLAMIDQADIQFKLLSQNLKSEALPFQELNISLGDRRMFFDEKAWQVWLPEQAYTPGSWGYVGGKVYSMGNTSRHSYGSDRNILGTDLDPVYATQRIGLEQFRLDVSAGDYELTLHFAELHSGRPKAALAYNLDSAHEESEGFEERVFDVRVNKQPVLTGLSNTGYLYPERAVSSKINISVKQDEGIIIDFKALKGEAMLNGVQVRRIR